MLPTNPIPYLPDGSFANAKPGGQRPPAFIRVADKPNNFLGEFGLNVFLTSVVGTVLQAVAKIFGLATPSKVFDPVVPAVVVGMSHHHSLLFRFAQKCNGDDAVDVKIFNLPVNGEGKVEIAKTAAGRRWSKYPTCARGAKASAIYNSLYAPFATSRIFGGERDCLPYFHTATDSITEQVAQ